MPSLQELEKKVRDKGLSASSRNVREVDADSLVEKYVKGYSSEGALKNSIEGLEGFCSYWEEQSLTKSNLANAEQYIEKINTIFSSYRTLRRNLDGTIAYLIGDWLLDCRKRFFPGDDRQTRGHWSDFLKKNLCNGFEKSTAYEFMAITEKLKEYRQNRLPLHTLKALLRAKNNGVDITTLDVEVVSSKEILSMRIRKSEATINSIFQKLNRSLGIFIEELENFDFSEVQPSSLYMTDAKVRLDQILKKLNSLNK